MAVQPSTACIAEGMNQSAFSPWQHINQTQLARFWQLRTVEKRRSHLERCLRLQKRYPDTDDEAQAQRNSVRRTVFLDLSMQVLDFCRANRWSDLKTSTLFSIMLNCHAAACETPGPELSLEKTYAMIETMLLRHAGARPPFSLGIFLHTDVNHAIEFASATFLRHLRMYQFVYAPVDQLELHTTNTIAHINAISSQLQPLSAATVMAKVEERESSKPTPETPVVVAEKTKEEDMKEKIEVVVDGVLLDQNLKTDEDKQAFEQALGLELGRMQREMEEKMKAQQDDFLKRLEALGR